MLFSFVISLPILYEESTIIPIYAIVENQNASGVLNIILTSIEGSLLSNGTFLITPDPFQKDQQFLIVDNGINDKDKSQGLISIFNIPDGTYTVTQNGTAKNFLPNTISKMVNINKTNPITTTSFVNILQQKSYDDKPDQSYQPSPVYTYNAKFVCGSIKGDEGPLRPGHYDTDISIYNKQKYPLKISWNVVSNNDKSSNSLLKTLKPESSTGIICKDIKNLINSSPSEIGLIEGFVIIRVDSTNIDSGNIIPSIGIQKNIGSTNEPVSIQVFYTANALDLLPHEIIVEKIVFEILDDPSGKIPTSLLNTDLGITTRSELNTISDQSLKIKTILASEFNITESEVDQIITSIKDTDIGATTMIDDHAISLFRLTS